MKKVKDEWVLEEGKDFFDVNIKEYPKRRDGYDYIMLACAIITTLSMLVLAICWSIV